jgi:hypothetical protein
MRIRIRDPGILLTLDPGWKKFGSGIRDNKSRIRNTGYMKLPPSYHLLTCVHCAGPSGGIHTQAEPV